MICKRVEISLTGLLHAELNGAVDQGNTKTLVVHSQVLASFLVQDLESEGLNPFLLTYIANSLFIIYLPLYYLAVRLKSHTRDTRCACSPCTSMVGDSLILKRARNHLITLAAAAAAAGALNFERPMSLLRSWPTRRGQN